MNAPSPPEDAPPQDAPPWTGRDIAIALFLLLFFWQSLAFQLLAASGFFGWLYGPDVVALCWQNDDANKLSAQEREESRLRVAFVAGPGAARLDWVEGRARRLAMIRLNT